MATIREFTDIGEKMGYKGPELKQFVEEQRERIRVEKEKDREYALKMKEAELKEKEQDKAVQEKERQHALLMKEAELKEKEQERLLQERQKELELKERERERQYVAEAQERERQHALRVQESERERLQMQIRLKEIEAQTKEKELELAKAHIDVAVRTSLAGSRKSSTAGSDDEADEKIKLTKDWKHLPKLPPFDEQRDDMDAYLNRFERFAEQAGWPQDQWSLYLSALLKGRALAVYSRLPADEAQKFDCLKNALLRRFELTEEGFKRKFQKARCEDGESPSQFLIRLKNYLERWIKLADVEQTVDGLLNFFVREQYLTTCSPELATFLKERTPHDLSELAALAEKYLDAHSTRAVTNNSQLRKDRKENKPVSNAGSETSVKNLRDDGKQIKRCFVCDKVGHLAKNCFRRVKTAGFKQTSTHSFAPKFNQNRTQASTEHQSQESTAVKTVETKSTEATRVCKAHGKAVCEECTMAVAAGHACGLLRRPELILDCGCKIPVLAIQRPGNFSNLITAEGWVNEHKVTTMRDTGCTMVVVKRSLVKDEQLTGRKVTCVMIDGTAKEFSTAKVIVKTPFLSGEVIAVCMDSPMYDLVIGNVDGATLSGQSGVNFERVSDADSNSAYAVVTRAQDKEAREGRTSKPLKVLEAVGIDMTKEQMVTAQRQDGSLEKFWKLAEEMKDQVPDEQDFTVRAGVLFRNKRDRDGRIQRQLVVPITLRKLVLQLGHDQALSGHLGIKKTTDRVTPHFYWPGLQTDIARWCQSCDVCQRTEPKGRTPRAPLGTMPQISTPFARVAVDLIGPISPATSRGHRYILTMVDVATRYPEATALKSIEAETVAEALVTMFTRVGVPNECLSDQGSQFMSGVMRSVSRLLSMKRLVTSPYHPICNGMTEKFNGVLKLMLKKLCVDKPTDWDRYIPALLFAYREVPQASLGYSPFELLYGRQVRGPLSILKEMWTTEVEQPEVKTVYEYVVDLKERLSETCTLAQHELRRAQQKQKIWYDKRARKREFKPMDKVLLLLPTDNNKLLLAWKGPFEVIRKVSEVDYVIQLPTREKIFHINMLKRYYEREAEVQVRQTVDGPETEMQINQSIGAVVEVEEESCEASSEIECLQALQTETYKDVLINPKLTNEQKLRVQALLEEFQDIFSDIPGNTNLVEHRILLTTDEPIRSKAYPIPFALRQAVDDELDLMIKMKVIERSEANYASPIVVVRKPDNSIRLCSDFRKINAITVFDPEPMVTAEEIFAQLAGDTIFSKFDMSRGYFQIPIKESDRDITTIVCHKGLFRFRSMAFGLVGAPATFARMMRKLLKDLLKTHNYLDDVLVHHSEWRPHLIELRRFFVRVRNAGLTLRPSKSAIGFDTVSYLGFVLDTNGLHPNPTKIQTIVEAAPPTTKKQLRSFINMAGYYRMFIDRFSDIVSILTDLTKKGEPNVLKWTDRHQQAFCTLKAKLSETPVLRLPDFSRQFILQTDASDVGIGAAILQCVDGINHPIAFASRKLLDRERHYSTVERECLAICWSVQKYQNYLFGREFILEVDHAPLQYLQKAQFQNSRLMRWALALQQYRYVVHPIPGKLNVCADFCSRCDL